MTFHEAAPHASSDPSGWAGPVRVTRCFLFTDIQDSTATWERVGDPFQAALELHHRVIAGEIARHGGQQLHEAGDGFLIAFLDPRAAVACAIDMQKALTRCKWPPETGPLQVRMGLHLGEVETRANGEYRGLTLHRGSRVGSAAWGGQIIGSAAVAHALAPEEVCDLGVFRLKGVPMPERLFQICWPEMPRRDFPKPNASPAFATELPVAFTEFFGRRREIAEVRRLLLASRKTCLRGGARGGRLITLTGPGGTGKTRLSLAVAESVAAEYSHAVWFVPLADLAEARLLPAAVRAALGIEGSAEEEPMGQIVSALTGQPSLLVLDNFEHFADEGAAFVQELLTRVPALECLVTARQRIGLSGERAFAVPPLALPRDDEPATLEECESSQLFLDRAQAVHSDFVLTARNAPAVAELCRRLEGVPLAIELAAARAPVLTPHDMVAALGRRLDAFASRDFQIPARHRSLRAAIDWSYDYLPAPLQQMFARLSVFRGGWTAEAAAAVAGSDGIEEASTSVVRALGELGAASLIRSEEAGETMRFTMLETLRQYAAERLALMPGELQEAQRCFCDFMRQFAEAVEAHEHDREQSAWLRRMDRELDNVRAALALSCGTETRGRLAGSLTHYWQVRGLVQEGLRAVEGLLAEHEQMAAATVAGLHATAGSLAVMMGAYEKAQAHFEETLTHFRAIGDRRNVAGMLSNIGTTLLGMGHAEEARAAFEESLGAYEGLSQETRRAQALCNLGCAQVELGDNLSAAKSFAAAAELQEQLGDECALALTLANQAEAALVLGDHGAVKRFTERSLELSVRLCLLPYLALNATLCAVSLAEQGKMQEAAARVAAAETLSRKGAKFPAGNELMTRFSMVQEAVRAALSEVDFLAASNEGSLHAVQWLEGGQ